MKYAIATAAAISLTILAALFGIGAVLNRIDDNRIEIDRVRASIPKAPAVTLEPSHLIPLVKRIDRTTEELQVCKARTEWLRIVLETFVPLGDRVRLPDPPPGWKAWPVPNPED